MITIPYTPDKLRRETLDAVTPWGERELVELMDVSHHPAAYAVVLRDMWARGETRILIEHDVVPTREQIESLESCPEPWCAFWYPEGIGWVIPPLGCVRLSGELMAATPNMWVDYSERGQGLRRNPDTLREEAVQEMDGLPPLNSDPPWLHCDRWLAAYSRKAGIEVHRHEPSVKHLHHVPRETISDAGG